MASLHLYLYSEATRSSAAHSAHLALRASQALGVTASLLLFPPHPSPGPGPSLPLSPLNLVSDSSPQGAGDKIEGPEAEHTSPSTADVSSL